MKRQKKSVDCSSRQRRSTGHVIRGAVQYVTLLFQIDINFICSLCQKESHAQGKGWKAKLENVE